MKKSITLLTFLVAVKLLSAQDGTLDSSFGKNGVARMMNAGSCGDLPATMFITSDGKNVQVGSAGTDSNTHYLMVRRMEDGSMDKTFGINGVSLADIKGRDGNAYAAVELPNGKYLLAGNCISPRLKYDLILMLFKKKWRSRLFFWY